MQAVTDVMSTLQASDFEWEGGQTHYQTQAENGFMSFRRGKINAIVTSSPHFAKQHRAATHVCRRLNLMHKPDRIAVFQAVLYGNKWQDKP